MVTPKDRFDCIIVLAVLLSWLLQVESKILVLLFQCQLGGENIGPFV